MEKLISVYLEYISKFGPSGYMLDFFDIGNPKNRDLKIMFFERSIKENKPIQFYDGYIKILDNYPEDGIWD